MYRIFTERCCSTEIITNAQHELISVEQQRKGNIRLIPWPSIYPLKAYSLESAFLHVGWSHYLPMNVVSQWCVCRENFLQPAFYGRVSIGYNLLQGCCKSVKPRITKGWSNVFMTERQSSQGIRDVISAAFNRVCLVKRMNKCILSVAILIRCPSLVPPLMSTKRSPTLTISCPYPCCLLTVSCDLLAKKSASRYPPT